MFSLVHRWFIDCYRFLLDTNHSQPTFNPVPPYLPL